MTITQLNYILNTVLNWPDNRKAAVLEHFTVGTACNTLQSIYCPLFKFNVYRDVKTVEKIYSRAFNIINAESL